MWMDADDGGEVRMSEGERMLTMRGEDTIGQGSHLHQAGRLINAADARLRQKHSRVHLVTV
jgi:hypothetical protein